MSKNAFNTVHLLFLSYLFISFFELPSYISATSLEQLQLIGAFTSLIRETKTIFKPKGLYIWVSSRFLLYVFTISYDYLNTILTLRTDVAIRMRRTTAIDVRTATTIIKVMKTATARRWCNSWKIETVELVKDTNRQLLTLESSANESTHPSNYANVWIMLTNDWGDSIISYPSS